VGSPGHFDPAVSLRARVQRVILGAVGMALLLFAVPLAIAVAVLVHSDATADLQDDATRTVASVGDGPVQPDRPVRIAQPHNSARIAVYTADGLRGWGHGPLRSGLAAQAADAAAHDGQEAGELAVVIPVVTDGQVVGSVRAAFPMQDLILQTVGWWVALLSLAGAALAGVRVLARRLAGGVAQQEEQLTVAAQALHRERTFTRDVTHQLRTPLSGLLTGLESAAADPAAHGDAVDTALDRARQLQSIVDDLNVVRRTALDARCDVVAEAGAAVARVRPPDGRRVFLRADDVPAARCAPAVVRQILTVLLDNAVRHGAGDITVTVETLGDTVSVEVADEGPGFTADALPGTGLRLAGDLAESVYGALLIRRRGPRPRVAALMPAVPDPASNPQASSIAT
jgi:signal transduction histidine kinase